MPTALRGHADQTCPRKAVGMAPDPTFSDGWPAPFVSSGYERLILAVDPAVSQRRSADASALVTLGQTSDNCVHCLEAICQRESAPELVQVFDDADRRWQPDLILFEANAAFKGIKDLLTKHARSASNIHGLGLLHDHHAAR